ncbi:hypothetical protein TVAG_126720 [Trichomonas vaginalis G3]|uniref:Uncharacterized protein n=1 Tax=Trichomonas vaginalis (strain ATCC PRA-98 / G3) TaxID=412133 RepID=A2FHT2_TRIV3|nr:hypothetical protein TVAGG3_0460730 [Trichomonas vaginalis G3]EAX95542.1 hypothetical protein TVAG_126720 [Trichomonas vaginalis G3]KAI5514397.1 hypothetical protein TVAGG3_0460730 [Trichomonas vaginalis G3]|eukprot:XP_001308472.1 hypothetical protein [Trichomonas vaginalis G3]
MFFVLAASVTSIPARRSKLLKMHPNPYLYPRLQRKATNGWLSDAIEERLVKPLRRLGLQEAESNNLYDFIVPSLRHYDSRKATNGWLSDAIEERIVKPLRRLGLQEADE